MHPIFDLSSSVMEGFAAFRPAAATFWGIPGHDHRWDDVSPAGLDALRSFLVDARASADDLPPPTDRWSRLALDVVHAWVDTELAAFETGRVWADLGHIASPFQGFHVTLRQMDASTPAGRDAIRARLAALPAALEGYRSSLAHGLAHGPRVSARQVRSCVAQGRELARVRGLHAWDLPESDGAQAAYDALTDWLEQVYLPRADPRDGIGADRYRAAAEPFLLAPLDVDATYAWGWEEVHVLSSELHALLARIAPGRTLVEAVAGWRTDPATTLPNADAFLDRIRAWQADALARLEHLLPTPPVARALDIGLAPAGMPPGAWYMPPSEDLSRPGRVRYSLPSTGPIPLFDQQSTACHEGFPGHHLQLALQATFADRLSRLHRNAFMCSGFAEGWALYAEKLVDEVGGYDSDLQRAGYLVNQLARACRVVLDIGLHTHRSIPADAAWHPGEPWTYTLGVAFMTEVGGLREEVSASEITRYLGWPGQAISYKVGQKLILEMRADWLASGGALLDFHDRLLGSGTVGLGLARREVFAA